MRAKLIVVVWSQEILCEVTQHLKRNRASFTEESARLLVNAMNGAYPHSQYEARESDISVLRSLRLPDEKDRHVIAAALSAGAHCICTHNVKDFPPEVLAKLGLVVMTPDDLLCSLIRDCAESMKWVHHMAVSTLAGATDQSTITSLEKAGAPGVAELVERTIA
ncbi:MAG: PIN domain-containing protein [Propionibacteriaceae bacterium]|nr:PIN domain-containing protein [Propionibacteriaceae bacterium]